MKIINKFARKYRVKSRNFTGRGLDLVLELSAKSLEKLSDEIRQANVEKFSILEYDSDDVL